METGGHYVRKEGVTHARVTIDRIIAVAHVLEVPYTDLLKPCPLPEPAHKCCW
jgi:hypothetical protein